MFESKIYRTIKIGKEELLSLEEKEKKQLARYVRNFPDYTNANNAFHEHRRQGEWLLILKKDENKYKEISEKIEQNICLTDEEYRHVLGIAYIRCKYIPVINLLHETFIDKIAYGFF